MAKILNSPTENTVENEIDEQNRNYLQSIMSKAQIEFEALERTGNEQAAWIGKLAKDIVYSIVSTVDTTLNNSEEYKNRVNASVVVSQVMQSVNAMLAGGVISPITGCDEEWQDVTVAEDVGQSLKINFRGRQFELPIESVQVNIRYPKIYRLNNDNAYAHRIDYFQFHDVCHPEHTRLTEDSIRFIKFPYSMETLHCSCIVENNTIMEYMDFSEGDISHGVVYPNQMANSAEEPYAHLIAPKIPFHMLEDVLDLEAEIAEYCEDYDTLQTLEKVTDDSVTESVEYSTTEYDVEDDDDVYND